MAHYASQRSRPLTGYRKASEYLYRAFTICFSLAALTLASPLLLAVSLLILVRDGRPVFFASRRLGKDKQPFLMYKFRTLIPEASAMIGADLFRDHLASSRALFTHSGRFLRESRLDEIPQFVNTLKGDMDLLGPRPVRPEVYEKLCQHIRGYDVRFTVRPGLIGYSQLFTPHSTSERIRALIDYKFLLRKHRYSSEIGLLVTSLGLIGLKLVGRTWRVLCRLTAERFSNYKDKRVLERFARHGVVVHVFAENPGSAAAVDAQLDDVNEDALAVWSDTELPPGKLRLEISVPVSRPAASRGARHTVKTVRCSGEIYYVKPDAANGQFRYVLKYVPASPFNYYLLHQHLIQNSILSTG